MIQLTFIKTPLAEVGSAVSGSDSWRPLRERLSWKKHLVYPMGVPLSQSRGRVGASVSEGWVGASVSEALGRGWLPTRAHANTSTETEISRL